MSTEERDRQNALVEAHLALVNEALADYLGTHGWATIYADDLRSAGMLALVEASRTYDKAKGGFRRYAYRAAIRRMQDESSRIQEVQRKNGAPDELRDFLPLEEAAETLETDAQTAQDVLTSVTRAKILMVLRANLTTTEVQTVSQHFGLDGRGGVTLTQIARERDVSRQAVAQQLANALRKLRKVEGIVEYLSA